MHQNADADTVAGAGPLAALLRAAFRWHRANARLRVVVCGVLLLVAVAILVRVFLNPTKQADFHVYYRAAAEAAAGIDPYITEGRTEYPFVYPPLTVYVFRPFTWLPWRSAQEAWFLLKVVALVGFLWMCHAHFVPLSGWSPATMLLFGLGYNQAILLELRAGNLALFEQTLLLGGFAALVGGRPWLFVVAVMAAGQFKLVPLLFLAVPLLTARTLREGTRWTFVGGLAAAAYVAANATMFPAMWREFVANASGLDDRGMLNPSSFAFIRDVLSWISGRPLGGVQGLAWALFAVMVVVVVAVSARAVVAHRRLGREPDRRTLVLFASVVYGLVLYRFKNYSYILLLVPAFDIIHRRLSRGEVPYSAVFVFFSLFGYGPLFGNLWTWVGYLGELRRRPAAGPLAADPA